MRIHSSGRVGCRYKSKISSRKKALAAAHRKSREIGEQMQAYKCAGCHCWHIGHAERYRARERRYVAALNEGSNKLTVRIEG